MARRVQFLPLREKEWTAPRAAAASPTAWRCAFLDKSIDQWSTSRYFRSSPVGRSPATPSNHWESPSLLLVTHTITQSRRERARAGGRPRPVLPLAGEADADGGRVGVRRPRRAGREDLPVGRRAVRPQAEGGGSADEELADPVGSESCDAGRSFRLARMLPGSLMCSPDAVSDPSSKNRIVWSGESP
eukprot:gene12945-biopygen1401